MNLTALKKSHPKRCSVGVVAMKENGDVLMGMRSAIVSEPHKWNFISGRAKVGEDPKKAAAREFYEETGRMISAGKLELIDTFHDGDFTFYSYLYRTKEFEPKLNSENTEFRWVSPEHPPTPMHFGAPRVLRAILKR